MILAEAAEQGSTIAAQAFFYIAIAVAVTYFAWQFYRGAKEDGARNTGWLSGAKKKDDVAAEDSTSATDEPEGAGDPASSESAPAPRPADEDEAPR